jgi:EAL domain-containing protein (putative c-di-GMP-specific phosphodiesterase class I)
MREMTASEEARHKAAAGCEAWANGIRQPFEFEMVFQPVVDLAHNRMFAFEALVRGPDGEGAGSVLSRVDATNLYAFDQSCRIKAIETASGPGLMDTGVALAVLRAMGIDLLQGYLFAKPGFRTLPEPRF